MIGYVLTDAAVLVVAGVLIIVVVVYIAFTFWVLDLIEDARRRME